VSASERLAELDAKVAAADACYRAAIAAATRQARDERGKAVTEDLNRYFREVQARVRDAEVDAERELTAELCKRMVDHGYVFECPQPGVLTMRDPAIEAAIAAALAKLNEARAERERYAQATAKQRAAEARKAEADRIREALAGDDPDAIREALEPPVPETERKRRARGVRWLSGG
jgi:hypothetical protein